MGGGTEEEDDARRKVIAAVVRDRVTRAMVYGVIAALLALPVLADACDFYMSR